MVCGKYLPLETHDSPKTTNAGPKILQNVWEKLLNGGYNLVTGKSKSTHGSNSSAAIIERKLYIYIYVITTVSNTMTTTTTSSIRILHVPLLAVLYQYQGQHMLGQFQGREGRSGILLIGNIRGEGGTKFRARFDIRHGPRRLDDM